MKSLRVWLLLLLAVLLPVRGALAIAMQCATPGAQSQSQVQAQHPAPHEHQAAGAGHQHHEMAADHADGHGQGDMAGSAHEHTGAADKCNLCAASCSVTALVSASMTVAHPQGSSAAFPHLHAPPPSYVSGGQDRPPRTI